MAGILTTSPFHTKTGAFVEQATRGQLKETDWQLRQILLKNQRSLLNFVVNVDFSSAAL